MISVLHFHPKRPDAARCRYITRTAAAIAGALYDAGAAKQNVPESVRASEPLCHIPQSVTEYAQHGALYGVFA